ncbi:hypothetical protein [Metabacillus sp. B2-18]|uniref:hypothetical protein n=1 Tax=Metabacillus sp. B2-18 TaxID=2897333 RepID=UPI001E30DF2C|nr:hypothetical protein [Metabacillus sp. B2-18]UGB31673.1 hypothetical protein LPC09_04115 [Metabacillus sp. B2-18]
MNAIEAKEKAKSNLPKFVDSYVKKAVVSINNNIKTSVDCGQFSTRTTLALPEIVKEAVIQELETHYQDLGYEVVSHGLVNFKIIDISWA